MLFSSITFLYFFLPATIFLYYVSPQKGRNCVLLVMSLLFYAWGEPVYVLLMLAQIAFVAGGQTQGEKGSQDILCPVCSFAVCGIVLFQIF